MALSFNVFSKMSRTPDEHYRMRRRVGNQHRSERPFRPAAKIRFGTSTLPRDCIITDVSERSAKVIAEYLDIPDEFTIIFSTGRPRQCRLAWRIGCELGAEFID
jgi:hypothetical protein